MTYKYYMDKDRKGLDDASGADIFVRADDMSANDGMVVVYSPIGQHGEVSLAYVKKCKEITKEEYLKISEGIYTPEEYIK